ncbi:pilus assembly FimT family protein [Halomonas sp. B23F22_10]|uniref:pilus assembly FimT family protein n=1 Tax=Halomonas sp. B23F22_10 TaxID=3459515 RepID=UPI00373EA232
MELAALKDVGKHMARVRGFTLIELLVTIAVVIILATIAVPGFQGMMARNQLASDYNEVLSGLYFARSEAIKRRGDVTLSAKSDSYSINVDGAVLRSRNDLLSTISLSEGESSIEIEFNKLGRIVEGSHCEDGCALTIGYSNADSKTIEISSFGSVSRGGS